MVRMSDIIKKVEQRKSDLNKAGARPPAGEPPQTQPSPPQSASVREQPSESAAPVQAEQIQPPLPPEEPCEPSGQPLAPPSAPHPEPAEEPVPPPEPCLSEPPAPKKAGSVLLGDDLPVEGVPVSSRQGVRITRSIQSRGPGMNEEEAIMLYRHTLNLIVVLFQRVRDDKDIQDMDLRLSKQIEKFVEQQLLDNDNIIGLVSMPMDDNYLYNHALNSAIIAVEIGIGLGYEKAALLDLGVAAVLADIGMVKCEDVYSLQRNLTEKEIQIVRNHTAQSFEILTQFKNISKRVATIAYQQHERQDGSGYPCGLKADSIDELVRIIAVADVYEAVSHPRPYRDEMEPHEALNLVIRTKDQLGPRGVKALIERICCPYPIGCYVKLSSGEKGMVVGRNIGSSFRPIVELFYHVEREGAEPTRIIDLKKSPTIYIKDYLSKEEIQQLIG